MRSGGLETPQLQFSFRSLEIQGFKLALHPPFCKASVSGSGFSAFRSPKKIKNNGRN